MNGKQSDGESSGIMERKCTCINSAINLNFDLDVLDLGGCSCL